MTDSSSDVIWRGDRFGEAMTCSNGKSQWTRAMAKAMDLESSELTEPFHFHDIKAKGYTDQIEQDAGHKSPSMHKVYNRKARLVVPADGQLSDVWNVR